MTSTAAHNQPGLAVIGSGYWGRNLVRNFHRLGVLKLICDKNAPVLEGFKAQYPQIDTCVALSEVLRRKDVEGVVVATPAETHFTIAREVLLAGKHVFVEKPLVLNEAEGRELKGVTFEDGVFCGPSMVFTNIYNPRAEISKMDQVRATRVKKGATIGANATIVCGTTLGHYSFVGAGAVVNRNVPDHALVIGNPAKQIGWMCACGERLSDDLECTACGKRYRTCTEGLIRNV